MNVTEYIASGILESYVMGAVSDQERREVECLSSVYPEIRHELDLLAEALEQYALLHRVEPPASVKDRLLKQLDFDKREEAELTTPTPEVHEVTNENETIVRPMPVDMSSSHTYRITWIVAASMGLLLLLFSFFLLSQLRTNQKTLASTQTANQTLRSEIDQTMALLSQPGLRTIELKGNEKAPQGTVVVFWNASSHQVAVNVKSLPALPADKQYQLWSMVDGKPVDAGVFDPSNGSALVQRLNRTVERADAFAITVEKRGGSPVPTTSTLLAVAPVSA